MYERTLKNISMAVACVGCVVLAGWLFDIQTLRSVAPGLPEMVPNTALGFLLCGGALRFRHNNARPGLRRFARLIAAVVAGLGLATILEYLSGTNFGIDRLLMPNDAGAAGAMFPGRMSPHTALNFALAGAGLIFSDTELRRGTRPAEFLALAAALVALLALVGYLYSVTFLYRISPQTGMALHTAIAFLLLAAGILLIHPDKGLMATVTDRGMGGMVARRLLLAAFIIPLLLGWLTILGRQMNLFDDAFSSSLLVVGNILVLSALILTSARTLVRVAAERRVAEEARTRLLHRVVGAQEEERRRIARELHDQMGQHLAALKLKLELHGAALHLSNTDDNKHLRGVYELADHMTHEVHALAWELRPPELDHLGLQAALARYVEQWSNRSGVAVDFVCTGFAGGRLPSEMEVTLYRVLQEALTNVLKHAQGKNVSLVIERSPVEVLAVVEDDGCGFDVDTPSGDGLGLLGMRERVELAGGTLKLESAIGAGTTLVVRIPLDVADERAGHRV